MPTQIQIPTVNYFGSLRSIEQLLASLSGVWLQPGKTTIDFRSCRFFSADGVAVLVALKLVRDSHGLATEIDWDTVSGDVNKQLGRWKVKSLFGEANWRWTDTAIPLFHQSARAPKKVVHYVDQEIIRTSPMPKMTADLAKETRKALCEVFGNIFQHADSSFGGVIVGQHYPNRAEIQICVCDGGVGIADRVQQAGHAQQSSVEAIKWALQPGNTTWTGTTPGGLGLHLLREFVKVNGGDFRLYANGGAYREDAGTPSESQLSTKLPGTLIDLRLKIRDDVVYTL